MTDASQSQLGKGTVYDSSYDPGLLFPLSRIENRASLGLSSGDTLPFHGEDLWTCYELSWLDLQGKPCVGIASFKFSADCPFMIESKSFKLYLNSLNHEKIKDVAALTLILIDDLSKASGKSVAVSVQNARDEYIATKDEQNFVCVDDLPVDNLEYLPNAELLSLDVSSIDLEGRSNEYFLCSHLLRSNCPVTGQPDWGTVYIQYRGKKISDESFLRYIISFRQCQDFHEHCVERIFLDILAKCDCEALSVYARYTRRGGLDINPYRATRNYSSEAKLIRTSRQ